MFHALSDEKPARNCIRLLQVEVRSSLFKKTIRVVSQVTVTLNCQVQLTRLPSFLCLFFSFLSKCACIKKRSYPVFEEIK
ncbi:hypothetical protein NC653_039915 [Populus alba x Populus x berolinensis]|uniref:Uncharacterized protein n=1 Tax=Populus alba x Populus x berolinensis TaxID=444605 RepID=A0AAD6PR60_9ROSI|nr:hypothetical protein NC653_039915 [Populus alba x Populus x berolinensis]